MLLMQNYFPNIFGKIGTARHRSPLDKDWNDKDAALQRPGNLLANIVPLAGRLALGKQFHPLGADHGEEDVSFGERLCQLLVETLTGQQVVDIHKYVGSAEHAGQAIPHARRRRALVIASIIDEDLAGHQPQPARNGPTTVALATVEVIG